MHLIMQILNIVERCYWYIDISIYYIDIYLYILTNLFISICTHISIYIYLCSYIYLYLYLLTYLYIYTYSYLHMHISVYTHIYIYSIYIYSIYIYETIHRNLPQRHVDSTMFRDGMANLIKKFAYMLNDFHQPMENNFSLANSKTSNTYCVDCKIIN